MLIEFCTGNYRSFRRPVTLSLLAANPVKEFEDSNVFVADRYKLLKSAVLYGANSSGKSNLLNAIATMRWLVVNSSKESHATEDINVTPFILDTQTENLPCFFEITFLVDGMRYRYGFEADQKSFRSEWLFRAKRIKEEVLFLRSDSRIEVKPSFPEGSGLEQKTRDNALFLSVVANFNGAIATKVFNWFLHIRTIHGLYEQNYVSVSNEMLKSDSQHAAIVKFMQNADLRILDMRIKENDIDPSEVLSLLSTEGRELFLKDISSRKSYDISTVHNKYDGKVVIGTAPLDFNKQESEGTKKFFKLLGPILRSLDEGAVVIADEIEAKLHPILTMEIVRLFLSQKSNPNNAQLIFATHDTNLLRHLQLRRDQIWFTEKTIQEATDLYSLAEIRFPKGTNVRKDARFEKDYFKGKYGAIPYLGDFVSLAEQIAIDNETKGI